MLNSNYVYVPKQSSLLLLIIIFIHAGGGLCLAIHNLSRLTIFCGQIIILINLVISLRKANLVTEFGKNMVSEENRGEWFLKVRNANNYIPVKLMGTSVVTVYCLVLNFVSEESEKKVQLKCGKTKKKYYSIVIFRDALSTNEFRRLTVKMLSERKLADFKYSPWFGSGEKAMEVTNGEKRKLSLLDFAWGLITRAETKQFNQSLKRYHNVKRKE